MYYPKGYRGSPLEKVGTFEDTKMPERASSDTGYRGLTILYSQPSLSESRPAYLLFENFTWLILKLKKHRKSEKK